MRTATRIAAVIEEIRGSPLGRYGAAIGIGVGTIVLRDSLASLVAVVDAPYLFGLTGIALAAWFGGRGAGMVATFLIALLTQALFVFPDVGAWLDLDGSKTVRAAAFIIQGLFLSMVIDLLVRARHESLLRSDYHELRVEITKAILGAGSDADAIDQALRIFANRYRASAAIAWHSEGGRMAAVSIRAAPHRLPEAAGRALAHALGEYLHDRCAAGAPSVRAVARSLASLEPAFGVDAAAPRSARHVLSLPVATQADRGERRVVLIELRRATPFMRNGKVTSALRDLAAELAQCMRSRVVERAVSDLSERLAERAQVLQAVLDTAPIGIAVAFDERCRTLACNAAGAAIIGRPASASPTFEPHEGHATEDVIPLPLRTPMREAIATGRPTGPIEFEIERPDGDRRSVYQYASPLVDANGRPRGSVGAFVDISELRRAERSVREREQAFRRSFECAGVGKAQIEPATGRFQMVNLRLCEMLSRTAEELNGRTFVEFLHESERARAQSMLEQLRDGLAGEATAEYRFVRESGGELYGATSITAARDPEGRATHIIAVIQDVTDRKLAEQELDRYRSRLEELVAARTVALEESHTQLRLSERMAALGTLCAGLGHDMGNLLLPVRLRLEAMAIKGLPANLADDVQAIGTCAEYLQRLANGLRLLSLDPERTNAVETTDVYEWWSDAESFLRNCLPRGVELERSLAVGLPAIAIGRHRLTQAIFNLVQNAGDALRDSHGGRVRVSASAGPDASSVRVSVHDNGPGMTPEVRARCLEPFFTSKARGISTGLGLSLVHGIVQQSGGSIAIESEQGRGTTFVLTLPVAAHRAVAKHATPPTPPVRAVISFRDQRLRTYSTAVARALGCEVDGDESASLRGFDLAAERRAVVWVVDGRSLTEELANSFMNEAPSRPRKIIAFGEMPDHPIRRSGVQWVESPAPSVIRKTLRESVTKLAEDLDNETGGSLATIDHGAA